MKSADFQWLVDHGAELHRRYAGKWIAVSDGKVVGVGDTAPEAEEQAKKRVPEEDYILEAIDSVTDVIHAYGQRESTIIP